MSQNKSAIFERFIGHLSNSIVHLILEKSFPIEEIREKYEKETLNSLTIAKRYREKINPSDRTLPIEDLNYIKDKIINRVKAELQLRINKGYKNINLNLVDEEVDNMLRELVVN